MGDLIPIETQITKFQLRIDMEWGNNKKILVKHHTSQYLLFDDSDVVVFYVYNIDDLKTITTELESILKNNKFVFKIFY